MYEYDRLIQLCDSLAGAGGVLDVEDRMKDVKKRYGFYPQAKWDTNIRLMQHFEKKMNQRNDSSDYMKKFMDMMGVNSDMDFSFISKESMKNQFCTDLYTKVGEHIQVPGTTIHVFYAKKMGAKYLQRYQKYFANPDICEYDLQHEELLLDADRWVQEVCRVTLSTC